MVAAINLSPHPGFTKTPNRQLYDATLSSDARLLLTMFRDASWQSGGDSFSLAYADICRVLRKSEKTVRVRIKELERAGRVRVQRLGWTRPNRYTLIDTETPSRARGGLLEREILPSPERECVPIIVEEDRGKDRIRAVPVDSNAPPPMLFRDDREEAATQQADDDDWHRSRALDLRRQMRDRASLAATAGRLRNVHERSGLSRNDFLTACDQAREKTRGRSNVQNRMSYWFSVLNDILTAPDQPKPSRPPRPPRPAVPPPAPAPIVTVETSPPDETWVALKALDIPDATVYRQKLGVLPGQVPGAMSDRWAKVAYARDRLGGEVARQ